MGEKKEFIYGVDSNGNKVTMVEDGKGGVYLSDKWKNQKNFWEKDGKKGHDHFDNNKGGTQRNQYTG